MTTINNLPKADNISVLDDGLVIRQNGKDSKINPVLQSVQSRGISNGKNFAGEYFNGIGFNNKDSFCYYGGKSYSGKLGLTFPYISNHDSPEDDNNLVIDTDVSEKDLDSRGVPTGYIPTSESGINSVVGQVYAFGSDVEVTALTAEPMPSNPYDTLGTQFKPTNGEVPYKEGYNANRNINFRYLNYLIRATKDNVVMGAVPDFTDFEIVLSNQLSLHAEDYIADYENPTVDEITFLMGCGRHVLFKNGNVTYPDITINLQGNTIWEAVTHGTYNITGTTTGYMADTVGNTGICGFKGIRFNGDFKAENIVRFSNCNVVYSEVNHAENITKTNDGTKNYRGGFIYLNITKLIQGGNSCKEIQQNTPQGFAHGQHQSFSYNNVSLVEWNGLANESDTSDKLWHCDGTTKGNTGHHVGKNINDNVCYILGTPQGLTATFDCDGYQEGIVFNPSGASEVNVPYCLLKNGTSKVMTLRSGSGLNVGVLKSFGSRTGISDDGFNGSGGVTIDHCYMQDITEERALSISKSGLTINGTLKTVNVASTNFNEVARVSDAANFRCASFVDTGSGAATCLRINELTTGSNNIAAMETNKTNKVVYESGKEFGGKSFIGRLNGFLIQGGAPSTLTIASGVITVSQNSHRVDVEGGSGNDELDTILGAPTIDTIITLQTVSNVRDVIVKHNTGNIYLPNGADIRLNSTNDTIQLKWNGSYWSKPV